MVHTHIYILTTCEREKIAIYVLSVSEKLVYFVCICILYIRDSEKPRMKTIIIYRMKSCILIQRATATRKG